MIFRKTLVLKFSIISLVLLFSVYVFTYHSGKIQPHYENLKNGLVWNKDGDNDNINDISKLPHHDDADKANGNPTTHESNPESHSSPESHNKDSKLVETQNNIDEESIDEESINEKPTEEEAKNLEVQDIIDEEVQNESTHDKSNSVKSGGNKYFDDIVDLDNSEETNPDKHNEWDTDKKSIMKFLNKQAENDPYLKKRLSVFSRIFELISDCKPNIEKLDNYPNGKSGVQFVHGYEEPYLTKEKLLTYLSLSEKDINDLTEQHSRLIEQLPNYFDSIYEKDSKGIVYVGGNKFSWLTLISIINMRKNNCQLPIEVLIPKYEEFELNICENILPKYNAKCIYLPTLVGDKVYEKYNFKGYQYKSLALALSSFENVLLLDADNTALVDPETVFHSNPYVEYGLLLWPDFWKRTTHPSFYDIIGLKVDENKRRDFGYKEYGKYSKPVSPDGVVLYHQLENTLPDPTTESGQLFMSKKKHFKALILSLYYNTYGPDYYYPLLSQGAAGEGDKETFMAAAHALGESYYAVKRHVVPLGRYRNGDFHGSAMGQYDPIGDYGLSRQYAEEVEELDIKPNIMFMHSNFPKMDPWSLKKDDIIYDKETGERNRLFGENFIDDAKYDFELRMWEIMADLLCEEKLEFYTFKNDGLDHNDVCQEVLEHKKYLLSTTKKLEEEQ